MGITILAGLFESVLGKAGDWATSWAADAVADELKSSARELERQLVKATSAWKETLREDFRGRDFDPAILWSAELAIDPSDEAERALAARLWSRDVPTLEELFTVLKRRYRRVRLCAVADDVIPPSFMRASTEQVEARLKDLAERLRDVCISYPALGRPGAYKRLEEIRSSSQRIEEAARTSTAAILERLPHRPAAAGSRYYNMAATLPAGLIPRPDILNRTVEHLLAGEATALSTALRGAGGMGKTMLAHMVAVDPRIRGAFPDGVLWVTLGESADVAGELAAIYVALRGEQLRTANLNAAVQAVRDAVGAGRYLLVIDDVWRRGDTHAFSGWGEHCGRLFTTRNAKSLSPQTQEVLVDRVATSQAIEILSRELSGPDVGAANEELAALADRVGEWPLLLGLVNAALVERVDDGLPFAEAISDVKDELTVHGIKAVDLEDEEDRAFSVARTMAMAMKPLKPRDRSHFTMLGIFLEDVPIPEAVLAFIWGSAQRAAILCRRLTKLSLVQARDGTEKTIALHDHIRDYLREELGDEGLRAVATELIGAVLASMPPESNLWPSLAEKSRYLFEHLPVLLLSASLYERAYDLVTDTSYLEAKAATLGRYSVELDVMEVVRAEGLSPEKRGILRSMTRAIRLGSDQPGALVSQIHTGLVTSGYPPSALRLCSPRLATRYPPQRPDGAVRALRGHIRRVNACAVLGDGRRVVSASADCTLRVWDGDTGQTFHILVGHKDAVAACVVLGDGWRIVSASHDATLRVWDCDTGHTLHTLRGHKDAVGACAVLGDGRRVVSASRDETLRVWDCDTGRTLHVLQGHTDFVGPCAVLGDGRRVVATALDGTLSVWDCDTGQRLQLFGGDTDYVDALAVLGDGRRVVSASDDETLNVWDCDTGQLLQLLEGHTHPVLACAVLKDGRRVISASCDRTLRVWDCDTGQSLHTLEGHTNYVSACAVLGDGRRVVSASDDRTMRVWDCDTGQSLQILGGHINKTGDWDYDVKACAVLGGGGRVVSASCDGTLRVWDCDTGQSLHILEGHTDKVNACAVLGGGRVVSASCDGTLRVWDCDTGQSLHVLEDHTYDVDACAVLGDGRRVVSASGTTLRVWDCDTGQSLHVLEGHTWFVHACAVLGDGRRVVSASRDRTLRVWDCNTGQSLHVLEGHTNGVNACAVLGGGERVVSASKDETLRVWDCDTGRCLHILEGHADRVNACAVLGGGRRVVSASIDHTLRVWDCDTGQSLHILEGHDGGVVECVVLGDGRRVVSASIDETLRVWDCDTGRCLHILEGHAHRVASCAVLGDGRRVVSASYDHTLRVWDCDTGLCIGIAYDIAATALAAHGNVVVVGDWRGNVWFIEVHEAFPSHEPCGSWLRRALPPISGSIDEVLSFSRACAIEQVRSFLLDAFLHTELRQLVNELHKPLHDQLPAGRLTSPVDVVNALVSELTSSREHIDEFIELVCRARCERSDLDAFVVALRTAAGDLL